MKLAVDPDRFARMEKLLRRKRGRAHMRNQPMTVLFPEGLYTLVPCFCVAPDRTIEQKDHGTP